MGHISGRIPRSAMALDQMMLGFAAMRRSHQWASIRKVLVGILWALVGWVPHTELMAWSFPGTSDVIAIAELPREGQDTYRLIFAGGPFPFDKDGVVFGNRERILPRERRGFYHEYTVPTPGARNRGARRIICGGRQMTEPEVCYYTQDHYASFRRIAP